MPIIPFLTDTEEAIEGMVKTATEIGVDYFVYNVLRLRGQVVKGYYYHVLQIFNRPAFEQTRKLYGSRSYPPETYTDNLYKKVKFFREKWGFQNRWRAIFSDKQLELF